MAEDKAKRNARVKRWRDRQPNNVCDCGALIYHTSKMCTRCAGRLGAQARWN